MYCLSEKKMPKAMAELEAQNGSQQSRTYQKNEMARAAD